MLNVVRHLVLGLSLLSAAPALAQAPDTYAADANTVVVVTPQPVVVTGASPQPPGAAEVPPTPGAPPAPYTDAWSTVSHINGQLVPVGQRGDYLIKSRSTNIASNPLGWLMGVYGISVSRAISQNVALRGDANLFKGLFGQSDLAGYELGATALLYFRRVFSGPFLEGGLMVRELADDEECYDYCSTDDRHTLVGPQVMFGWHWTFDSGWNAAFAFGFARNLGDQDADINTEPAGYLRVGYAY